LQAQHNLISFERKNVSRAEFENGALLVVILWLLKNTRVNNPLKKEEINGKV
jgi:hypothetical protein